MTLKQWIDEQENLTQADIASKFGITREYLNYLANNPQKYIPSRGLALRIEQATDGEVTALELLFPNDYRFTTQKSHLKVSV